MREKLKAPDLLTIRIVCPINFPASGIFLWSLNVWKLIIFSCVRYTTSYSKISKPSAVTERSRFYLRALRALPALVYEVSCIVHKESTWRFGDRESFVRSTR